MISPSTSEAQAKIGPVMERDAITIFIGCRNHRAWLPRLLHSAREAAIQLEEEGFATEILLVDNASRDGSLKLARTVQALYNDLRIRVIGLSQEIDWADLRNLGLSESRTRYVCLLDPNRELVPETLPLFLKSIVATRASMAYGNLLDRDNGEVTDIRSNMAVALRLPEGQHLSPMPVVDAHRILSLGGYARVHPGSPESWEMLLHLISEEQLVVFVPVVMGYHYPGVDSRDWEPELTRDGAMALQRIHNWNRIQSMDNARVGRLYHPHVGFLDK